MRVRVDPATLNRDITVPRPVSRQKSYKHLLEQASTSSDSSSGSSRCINNRIEEEGEDNEMVLGGSSDGLEAKAATSQSRNNGNDWLDRDEYDSDKEDDEDDSQEPVVGEIGPQLPSLYDNYNRDDNLPNSGIIVTVISPSDDDLPSSNPTDSTSASHQQDNKLLIELRVREYQVNFDGFAEINRFTTIEDMHEFIVNNSETLLTNEPSSKQDRYLEILLNERAENRFDRLAETSRGTVRHLLAKNEHILKKLYSTASLENFPSPLKESTNDEIIDDVEEDEADDRDEKIVNSIEENMKRWYMIEMIGIWLKFISDVKSYREAIKKRVLKANCGIENDRYEGIAVPLKYK